MSRVDPITVEVINNYLISAAQEMMRNLMRTSYNTIVYEIRDFGLGIYDRRCRMLAEAPGLATFTRVNGYAVGKIVDFLGEENIHPGDVILLNYPYWSAGHTLDVLACTPIFAGESLVGFTAARQHWLDLKQKDIGYCLDTRDMHEEGLFFPCSKIYNRGVLNKDLENLIRFNCRMPDRVIGDMNAQISSCKTGERRVQELVERFGIETFEEAVEQTLDHGERISRSRLAALPKGTWTAEDFVDDDGIDKEAMVKIKATVTITEDEMVVDFAGSSPATQGPINNPMGLTVGIAGLVFKALTTPDLPANEGHFRPLRVEAPEGSLMNAVPPAATFTLWTGLLAPEVVTKALAQGLPNDVPACSGGDVCSVMGVGPESPQRQDVARGQQRRRGVRRTRRGRRRGWDHAYHRAGVPQPAGGGRGDQGAAADRQLRPAAGLRRPRRAQGRPGHQPQVPVPGGVDGRHPGEENQDQALGHGRRLRR